MKRGDDEADLDKLRIVEEAAHLSKQGIGVIGLVLRHCTREIKYRTFPFGEHVAFRVMDLI